VLDGNQVHELIEAELTALEELVSEIRAAGKESAQAEASFKIEQSKARLTIKATQTYKMTVQDIDAETTIATEELLTRHLIAVNALLTAREALRASQARLDGLRSLMTSLRTVV
jgi:glutathionylspermidine synthase